MTRLEFCTYFDSGYLGRALVLHDSLARTGTDFRLTALCLDETAFEGVESLNAATLQPVRLSDVERFDPMLLAVKSTRKPHEYYFTLGPSFLEYLLDGLGRDAVTYLDADMRFYEDPAVLVEEASGASTVIVGHRFPERLRHLEEAGRYNVSWVGFTNDADGSRCLEWWRERCIEWCFDTVEDQRYADQKYLDAFPDQFAGVHVLEHPGADVAPWNVADPPLTLADGRFFVAGKPLVFYHFQGFRLLGPRLIDPNLAEYGNRVTPAITALYREYATELGRWPGSARAASPRRQQRVGTLRGRLSVARSAARRELVFRRSTGA